MIVNVKCNHCGCVNHIEKSDKFECSFCKTRLNTNECYIEGDEYSLGYNIINLKNAVYNAEYDKLQNLARLVLNLDPDNIVAKYYILDDFESKKSYLNRLESFEYNQDIDQIIRYDILFNENVRKKDKIDVINNVKDVVFKDKYLKYLNNTEVDNELKDKLIDIEIENEVYTKPIHRVNFVTLFLVIAILITLLTLLLNKVMYKGNYGYAVMVASSIIPSFIYTISASLYIKTKVKNKFLSIILDIIAFIVIFIVLSYLLTIKYHEGNMFERIVNHFKQIGSCFFDIAKELGSEWEGENDTL